LFVGYLTDISLRRQNLISNFQDEERDVTDYNPPTEEHPRIALQQRPRLQEDDRRWFTATQVRAVCGYAAVGRH